MDPLIEGNSRREGFCARPRDLGRVRQRASMKKAEAARKIPARISGKAADPASVGSRHATAHEECRGPLEYKYNAYAAWGLENRTAQSSGQGSFEEFARDRFIIGDKVSVKEEIARYRELLGVDHFIVRCQWPGLPQERALSSIQRLGEIFAS